MTLVDALVIIGVFGAFSFLIWSKLVSRNHPVVDKVKQWINKPKEKMISLSEHEKWQQPNIDKKIF